jgi:hypothetical protein
MEPKTMSAVVRRIEAEPISEKEEYTTIRLTEGKILILMFDSILFPHCSTVAE